MATVAEQDRALLEARARQITRETYEEDVRSATKLIARLEKDEEESALRGRALEQVMKTAKALPGDLHWDGHLLGGSVSLGLQTVAGSGLRFLNQQADRRASDIARAKKKLAVAQAALSNE
jgi:hypothetical protein